MSMNERPRVDGVWRPEPYGVWVGKPKSWCVVRYVGYSSGVTREVSYRRPDMRDVIVFPSEAEALSEAERMNRK